MDSLPFLKTVTQGLNWFKSQHFARNAISPRYALLEACLIGIFSALSALLLKEGINFLGTYRLHLVSQWGAMSVLPLFGLILGTLAGFLVEWISPSAAGGGIPQIKAALARAKVPLSFRVALAKIIGTILVLGAGLTLGRRAPTVHIGAALAGELTRYVPTSPEHRRQMIAAGAAAGLAAGFNTPIAGVMFVVEELMRDISNLTLETAIVASFTGAVVSLILQSNNLQLPKNILETPELVFIPSDIPFYILLGIVAGILGALFNRSVLFSFQWNERFKIPLALRIGLAGLISGFIVALLPPFFQNNAGISEFLIRGELTTAQIALVFVAHYILTIIAAGSGAPGGLFAPALIMGSALGYLIGDLEGYISGTVASSIFSLAGMGALFTGVVRVPVTAIIIVFELNGNFNLVLPLMISCAVAYISAETLESGSIYRYLLLHMGMDLQEKEQTSEGNFLAHLKAGDVMQSQVETVNPDMTVTQLLELMSASHHRGFPVVKDDKLLGIITQSDLGKVKSDKSQITIAEIMTRNPVTINAEASLTDVLYLLNRYELSRLPVLENNRLVGIITRTDIIRAEVKELKAEVLIKPNQSYTIYQTCSPATGKGCILVPIEEDDDFRALFKIAGAIALERHYELEFVQVIKVPQYQDPHSVKVDMRNGRHIMHTLERMGRKKKIPTHTRIVVAHHRSAVVLEIIKQRHINILIMGWKRNHHGQDFIFSRLIDSLINKAECELILVKLGEKRQYYPYASPQAGGFILPMGGGPNVQEGLKLVPALMNIYDQKTLPTVWLTKIHSPEKTNINLRYLQSASRQLQKSINTEIHILPIASNSVVSAVIQVAEVHNSQLVILGASRDSLLKQAYKGNIPEAIANHLDTTVIIVRLP